MSDIGYSTEYEVYLTVSNGVQIVTNDLSLQILKRMRSREISPSEISAELDVSKSTVQANIGKLLRTGIVSQEVRVGDARSAVYRVEADLLFTSETDEKWQTYARSASIDRIMRSGRCTNREDLSLYGVSLTESGLNIVQGLFSVGEALSKGEGSEVWMKHMLNTMKKQSARYGIKATMDITDGLKLRFVSEHDDISDITLIVVPMIGAISAHSRSIMGYDLAHELNLKVSDNGRKVEMLVPRFVGQGYPNRSRRSPESFVAEEPFSIYSIGGKATLFTNPTMMAILDNLFNSEYSLNDLEEVMGVPKPTIYASLMKLNGMGAVEVDPDSGSPKKYRLLAEPILYITDNGTAGRGRLDEIVGRFQNGSIDYYSAVISYAMESLDCMGIHFDKMFVRSGKHTAAKVLEKKPDYAPQDFVDLACQMVSPPDNSFVVTYLPIVINVTLSKKTLWVSWPGDFVMGFLMEGLRRLLGEPYRITVEVYREGETEPMIVMKS